MEAPELLKIGEARDEIEDSVRNLGEELATLRRLRHSLYICFSVEGAVTLFSFC